LTETRWLEGASDHRLARDFDALGRITRSAERTNGVEDPGSIRESSYDIAVMV